MTMQPYLLAAALTVLLVSTALPGHALEPNPELLDVKGYSPHIVDVIGTQRSRMEWKEPPPRPRSPLEQFWHNVWTNDWTGSLDPFGYGTIREDI